MNDLLLPGPDLLNSLVGILLRFRLHDIALGCDIEKMFYQFRVCPSDRDFLRFFWFEDNDITKPVSVFRMTVHIFGAVSSPSVATFGLRYLANKHRQIWFLISFVMISTWLMVLSHCLTCLQ